MNNFDIFDPAQIPPYITALVADLEQHDAATYQQLCIQVRQTACANGWVTEENDQCYAWESVVVAWLLRYRPHRVASPQIEEESIQTALGECDSLLLWGQKRF